MKTNSRKISKKKVAELLTEIPLNEDIESGTSNEFLDEHRRVLLAITDDGIDSKTLSYTVTLCKRIKAELDILYVKTTPAPKNSIEDFMLKLMEEGVFYRLLAKSGHLKHEIISYTESNREILYVIMNSSDNSEVSPKEKTFLSGLLRNLNCPLVVI
ncbi:universal stress protein [Candidatus Magnetomonas plexicatena]|uniref:universal stress protein n=1 Tax=Candidatus Magnetomonas plexicatena TaxID=2552947 RepID=UPI001C763AD5|nr:universal stress protein [Nitrospirales bacterium LBB_01]